MFFRWPCQFCSDWLDRRDVFIVIEYWFRNLVHVDNPFATQKLTSFFVSSKRFITNFWLYGQDCVIVHSFLWSTRNRVITSFGLCLDFQRASVQHWLLKTRENPWVLINCETLVSRSPVKSESAWKFFFQAPRIDFSPKMIFVSKWFFAARSPCGWSYDP